MFKGMESQSVHVIEIIKNGYDPKERPESIFWYQSSRSFGVSLASSNLVMCPSTQMHIDVLLGSEQASWKLSSHAASASFSDPGTDLKAAPVAVLQSQVPIIMSFAYLRNSSNMFVGQVLPSGQEAVASASEMAWALLRIQGVTNPGVQWLRDYMHPLSNRHWVRIGPCSIESSQIQKTQFHGTSFWEKVVKALKCWFSTLGPIYQRHLDMRQKISTEISRMATVQQTHRTYRLVPTKQELWGLTSL